MPGALSLWATPCVDGEDDDDGDDGGVDPSMRTQLDPSVASQKCGVNQAPLHRPGSGQCAPHSFGVERPLSCRGRGIEARPPIARPH